MSINLPDKEECKERHKELMTQRDQCISKREACNRELEKIEKEIKIIDAIKEYRR